MRTAVQKAGVGDAAVVVVQLARALMQHVALQDGQQWLNVQQHGMRCAVRCGLVRLWLAHSYACSLSLAYAHSLTQTSLVTHTLPQSINHSHRQTLTHTLFLTQSDTRRHTVSLFPSFVRPLHFQAPGPMRSIHTVSLLPSLFRPLPFQVPRPTVTHSFTTIDHRPEIVNCVCLV